MDDYSKWSRTIMDVLELDYEPVAVTLIRKGQKMPEGYDLPEKNIKHCQSIMRARKGEMFLVPQEKHACPVGGSALGIMPIPDKVKSGEFHFNTGMYDTLDAARKMIEQRPQMDFGSVIATAVSPLSKAKVKPDVVIVTGIPEKMYWLVPVAATFFKGGKMLVEMEPFQASCAYSTVYPYMNNTLSLSIGCFGCRKSTDIASEEVLVGIPFSKLEDVVKALDRMRDSVAKSKIKAA